MRFCFVTERRLRLILYEEVGQFQSECLPVKYFAILLLTFELRFLRNCCCPFFHFSIYPSTCVFLPLSIHSSIPPCIPPPMHLSAYSFIYSTNNYGYLLCNRCCNRQRGEYKIRKMHTLPSRSSIDYGKKKLQDTKKSAIKVRNTNL